MNDKQVLRFGIVGCGNIAQTHMQALQGIPNARLAAVTDVNSQAAAAAAKTYGCRAFASYQEMIQQGDIDIVNICTPSGLRRDIAIFAARQHKHLVLEKPAEVTTERIDDILAAASENDVTVHGIFIKRYDALYSWLHQAVAAGRFGLLFMADIAMKWYRPETYYQNTWRGTWALDGGGALMNQGIHFVDLLQWLMGPPVSVFAVTDRFVHRRIETEDTAAAILRFAGGAMGMIQASTAMAPGFSARMSIHGPAGGVIIENDHLAEFSVLTDDPADDAVRRTFLPSQVRAEGVATHIVSDYTLHQRQLADIVTAIQAGRESGVSGREARQAVRIVQAIYRSAAEHREIFLD